MTVTIFHNPRCSKSRQTLQLLREHGHELTIIEYLETPPDEARLRDLLAKLDVTPLEIMRTGEAAFTAARDTVRAMSSDAQLSWLARNPEVLQRPIVVAGDQARVGRPPESVLEILPPDVGR